MPVPSPTFLTSDPVRCQCHFRHSPHPILSGCCLWTDFSHLHQTCTPDHTPCLSLWWQLWLKLDGLNSSLWLMQLKVESLYHAQYSSCWLHQHSLLACCDASFPVHYCRWTVTVQLIPLNNSGQPCTGEIQKTNIQQTPLVQYTLIWGAQSWCFLLELTVVFFSLHLAGYTVVTRSSLLSILCWNWPAHSVLISMT